MAERAAVPMVDLHAQYVRIRREIDAAMARVIESTQFIKGEEVGRVPCRCHQFAVFFSQRQEEIAAGERQREAR